jgi:hypothetical protein
MRDREARVQKNLRVIHEEKFDRLARLSQRCGARARRRTQASGGARRGHRGARGDQTNRGAEAKDLLRVAQLGAFPRRRRARVRRTSRGLQRSSCATCASSPCAHDYSMTMAAHECARGFMRRSAS